MKEFRVYTLGSSTETIENIKKSLKLFGIVGFQFHLQVYRSTKDLVEEIQQNPDKTTPCVVILSYVKVKQDGVDQLSLLSKLNLKGILVLNSELRNPPWEDAAFQAQLNNLQPGYGINYLGIAGSGFAADRIKQALMSIMPWPV